jgi:hypothetical protein
MAATNVQAFSGDVEVAGGLSITGSVTSTAGIDKVNLATDGTNASRSIIFSTGTTGAQPLKTDAGITYNPSNNQLTVSGGLSTSVTPGSYLTGNAYNGSTARTFAVDATTTSTASKVVARDASKNVFVNNLYVGDSTTHGITKYTGQYGSVSTLGAGSSSYAGYAIRGDWVFMSNGASLSGIYDDTNNKWATRYNALGATQLYHAGNLKLETTSTGVAITGTASATTFEGELDGNAGSATNVRVDRDDTGDTAMYLTMVNNNTAENSKRLYMDTNLVYDNTNNRLTLNSINIADYIYHSGDPNTYIGFNGGDSFRIVENASVALQVNNDSTIDIQNYIRQSGNTNTYMGFNASNQIVLRTNGGNRVTVTSNGNVGIGVTEPGEKLQIVGDSAALTNDPSVNNYGQLSLGSSSNYTGGSKPTQLKIGVDHTAGGFGKAFIQGIVDYVNSSVDLLLCHKGGAVGIGTTSPAEKLHIQGQTRFVGSMFGYDYSEIKFYRGTTTSRIAGYLTPGYNSMQIRGAGGGGYDAFMQFGQTGQATQIYASTTITEGSDDRIKYREEERVCTEQLYEDFKRLKVYRYEKFLGSPNNYESNVWIPTDEEWEVVRLDEETPKTEETGVIAQELLALQSFAEDVGGSEYDENGKQNIYGVAYHHIFLKTIPVVQRLIQEIETLKIRVETLENV